MVLEVDVPRTVIQGTADRSLRARGSVGHWTVLDTSPSACEVGEGGQETGWAAQKDSRAEGGWHLHRR